MAFLIACLLGTLYSLLIGLAAGPLRTPLIAWPLLTGLLWQAFRKLNLVRFSGYFAVVPVSILAFEITRTIISPSVYAYKYIALDRSHYKSGVSVSVREDVSAALEGGSGPAEVLIGKDGFRADPDTGQGNPDRCGVALIGDSMVYGSGLPYSYTLRPALAALGVDACIFGVTGNTPTDYLATLKYVAKRVDSGAHVAIYLYAYNDFVGVNKYLRRRFRALSSSFESISQLAIYYDNWRRTTFTHGWFRRNARLLDSLPAWQIKVGAAKTFTVYYPHDPTDYVPPPPLNKTQRLALKVFFGSLREFTRDKLWRVSIVIIPDNGEVLANLARQAHTFEDLDPRRMEALRFCRAFSFGCEDLTRYFYKRTLAEGENPYLINDRHFSAFGTRVVAEHFLAVTGVKMVWGSTPG